MTKLAGQCILIVEDDAMISLDLEYTLAEAGAAIVGPASTIRRALELAETPGLTAALVALRDKSESPCQRGAVHTWDTPAVIENYGG